MSETDSEADQSAQVLSVTAQDRLSTSVAALLDGADTADLAVGYLFVDGLAPLMEALDRVGRIRLLIGNVVNRLTDEQMREAGIGSSPSSVDDDFAATYRQARDRAATETALNLTVTISALRHTERNRDLLLALARWIASGQLSVRLSTRHRLHAKVAIASYPATHPDAPGRAVMGTTNVTMPESVSSRDAISSDIDVLLQGKQNYDRLSAWFENHWLEAQDFQRDLFTVLGRAWPLANR